MDQSGSSEYSVWMNTVSYEESSLPIFWGPNSEPGLAPNPFIPNQFLGFDDSAEITQILPQPITTNLNSSVPDSTQEDDSQDCDFSDEVLRYINQILMEEEDVEGKTYTLQDSIELQAAEKSFHEAIEKKHPPPLPLSRNPGDHAYQNNIGASDGNFFKNHSGYANDEICFDQGTLKSCWAVGNSTQVVEPSNCVLRPPSQSTYNNVVNGSLDSPISTLQNPDLYNQNQLVSLFNKGAEEASKLISNFDDLIYNVQTIVKEPTVKGGNNGGGKDWSNDGIKGRKHARDEVIDLEQGVEEEEERRRPKQQATYDEPDICSNMFDKVLLFHANDQNETVNSLRDALQSLSIKKAEKIKPVGRGGYAKSQQGRRARGDKETVDLRSLLVTCAQSVAIDDRRSALELLKHIRQHSTLSGDGNQRLAACFADGLEARLAGNGSQIYRSIVSNKASTSEILKAYLLYLAACPFRKISQYFANKSIANVTQRASKIHIIDFGIHYGFQWPTFIQKQSIRPGGAPKIRLTGIDFPQPGFRPSQRVQETGRRLAHYAEEFNIPFEFNTIVKRWESIQLQDFQLRDDEVVIVNCIYRMKNLPDETMMEESSRTKVLNMMREVNPALFVQGVVNGAYSTPFFLTRFKEALFHFSSYYDMLDTIVPRESGERMLMEKEILRKEALNVVACESWDRVERPETYKQWRARTLKAGFKQLQLDPEIKKTAAARVAPYHKDFVIDEDGRWLLLGWKGRVMYALSTWKPCVL